ncbi:MAG: SPFH domain-containing protein [Rubripirellula sp.]|nr:SPFH domain-containing protein [Rubripirellula sp.]
MTTAKTSIFSEMGTPTHVEKVVKVRPGWVPLFACLGMVLLATPVIVLGATTGGWGGFLIFLGIVAILVGLLGLCGLLAIQPNSARVLLLFGDYRGTVKDSGFFWVNPFYSKKKVSLRVRNFETGSRTTPEKKHQGVVTQERSRSASKPSKVNDRDGNPIEISAVVVWKVIDTAEALFEVDDFEHFVEVQSEAALRGLATRYPYDIKNDEDVSLRGNTEEICDQLRDDIKERLEKAGVDVLEARISHLAYAPEIAAAMLQRQQAGAVVAARTKIVDGAVGMVDMALEHLKRDNIVELTDEQRATLVSNLLVVLCSDRHTQPVVQAGS